MRTRTLLLYASLFSSTCMVAGAGTGPESPPPELKGLIARDESILAFESADLNGDGLPDVVFVVEPEDADNRPPTEGDGGRTLKIALRSPGGALRVVKESSRVVYCRSCGGVFGDPFSDLSAANKTFSVHHYGGSAWRWSMVFTFNYSKRDNTWQLVRVDKSSFHATEPDKQTRKTYRPPRSFGKIDIADFDPEHFEGVGAK